MPLWSVYVVRAVLGRALVRLGEGNGSVVEDVVHKTWEAEMESLRRDRAWRVAGRLMRMQAAHGIKSMLGIALRRSNEGSPGHRIRPISAR